MNEMNKRVIAIVSIICGTLLLGTYLFLEKNRYSIVTTEKGVAYKLDKQTGKTWFVRYGSEKLTVLDSNSYVAESKTQKETAIRIAKSSHLLSEGGTKSNEQYIRKEFNSLKGDVNFNGWQVCEVNKGVFLVANTATLIDYESPSKGIPEVGYFFEVVPSSGIIRYVEEDSLLAKKYGLIKGLIVTEETRAIMARDKCVSK
ncbi:MAG: hypothetical protein HQ568_09335 [Calditrichaeota bacterium]|nr:hypothetical protein [Calditrichota bacterium]